MTQRPGIRAAHAHTEFRLVWPLVAVECILRHLPGAGRSKDRIEESSPWLKDQVITQIRRGQHEWLRDRRLLMRDQRAAIPDDSGPPAEIEKNELKRFKPLVDEVRNRCGCMQDRRVSQESRDKDASTDRSRQASSRQDRCPVQDSKNKTRCPGIRLNASAATVQINSGYESC